MRLFKIDNEMPDFAEWDAGGALPDSTAQQVADPTSPGLGEYSLHVQTVQGRMVIFSRNAITTPQAGEVLYVGFWLRVAAAPTGGTSTLMVLYDAINLGGIRLTAGGQLQMQYLHDGPFDLYGSPVDIPNGWIYVVLGIRRATASATADGWYRLFLNGALADSAENVINNGPLGTSPALYVGCPSGQYDDMDVYFDDVTASLEEYPEPYSPPPVGECPEANRTIVLYRAASADSYAFADHCVAALGVPRANLCPLPNASGDETLADYAAFQTQVEDDLAAWLERNPIIASRATTFLIGHGVPGAFSHGGVIHSASSRLMRLGQAFSSQTANPLYLPGTVSRLTVSDVQSAGVYLATRIDAADLATAQALLNAGANAIEPASGEMLYSDDTEYRVSLARQRLRLAAADINELVNDALVFGDTTAATFGTAGSRAALVDDGADSAASLRSGSSACCTALAAGYASIVGSTDDAESFDPAGFFEMLRIGGTLAEAFAVAAAHLDYTGAAVGNPLLNAQFPLGGHNVYHGLGGVEAIDWSAPVACLGPGQTTADVSLAMTPGEWHVLAARAVSAAGVEEGGAAALAFATTNELGELAEPLLPAVTDVTGEALADGSVRIHFTCHQAPGLAEPAAFEVLSDDGTGGPIDLDNPLATLNTQPRTSEYSLTVSPASLPVRLAVRARDDEHFGPVSAVIRIMAISQPALPMTL